MRAKGLTARDMSLCALFAALIAAGAFIKIVLPLPVFPMHFTLQWLFVLLAGLILGSRLGWLSVCLYLLVGLMGVPIFAAGGGPAYVLRPTFGFLLGFAASAAVTGWSSRRLHGAKFRHMMVSSAAGLTVYYMAGIVYFYLIQNYVVGITMRWSVAAGYGLVTVVPDFGLCMMASGLAVKLKPEADRMLACEKSRQSG